MTAPNAPDEVSAAWIAGLLAAAGVDVGELGIETVDLIGQGFLGTVARVKLLGARPGSLVFKFGHDDPDVRSQAFGVGIYQRESWFYSQMAAEIPLRTPRCWYAHTDADADRHVLVFDDLSGLSMIDQLDGCPIAPARSVVDDLAALHGRFWGATELDGLPRADEDEGWFELVDRCVDGTLARPDLTPELRELTTGYPTYGRSVIRQLGQHPTMVHADARIENVFFAVDGSRTWIDWDGVQVANGAAELAYFLSQSLTVDVRREHEVELVERYHAGLGVDGYSLEDCWADYRLGLFAGWAVGMAAIDAYGELSGPAADLVSEGIARVGAAIADNDAMDLVR